MIFPWQQDQWKTLSLAYQSNRLPHAILLSGIAGIGKSQFADSFSRALLCEQPKKSGEACEACHSCRMHIGHAHPNMLWIQPEKEGHAIKVDQIREITEFANQSSFQSGFRIIIIHPANAMNLSAANALLKSLEEPPAGAIFILVSDQAARLPATIISRCQRVIFTKPSHSDAMLWLANQVDQPELLLSLSHDAPLAAIDLAKDEKLSTRHDFLSLLCDMTNQKADPIQSAVKLKETELLPLLDSYISWLLDILRLQMTDDETTITNIDFTSPLLTLKNKIPTTLTAQLINNAMQVRRQISLGVNVNKQLVIEDLMIRWMRAL